MKIKKSQFSRFSKAAISFYVLSVILLFYGSYMIVNVYQYLCSYYDSVGMNMGESMMDNVQYFVANCSSYFVYSILCYGIGLLLQRIYELTRKLCLVGEKEVENKDFDEEIVRKDNTIEYHSMG